MKLHSIILSTLITGSVAAAPVADAHAGGCESGTKIAADIWDEHDVVLKKLGCAIVSVASEGAVPPNACLDAADKVAKVVDDMIKFWNGAAKNSWAKIGPRRLALGETLKGKLVSTGGRLFITDRPLEEDSVELRLEKLDGKAKTEVTVCSEFRGKQTKKWSFMIENGNDNTGKVWKKTLTGMRGHILMVHLDARSVANTMQYELRAEQK
ncbi:MAG TPA: hypothetical protein VG755_06950 [Nannocystaceae bacterium]|nr:hypothetical protein [Nannocystaceae bacterium]